MATISVSASIHAGDGVVGGSPAKIALTNGINNGAFGFTNFITRSGDKLMDGSLEFRFISMNCPILHFIEHDGGEIPDPFEQEDAVKSMVQMGGTVVRDYVLTVRKESDSPELAAKRMITGPNTFNETAFRALDKVLELCNRYGVRIIIPFTDQNDFFGAIPQLESFRGGAGFYSDPQLRQDFKAIVNYLVNRTNCYTGIKYKDDKAILAWETGNELNNPDEWCRDIASYLKSRDPNHLIMDGAWRGLRPASLADPNIDIVSNHYYPDGYADFIAACNRDRSMAKGKKVFVVGEFGLTATSHLKDFLDTVINNGTSGALLWALRPHKKDGGFHHHQERGEYKDYHWPGFASGKAYDEIAVLDLIRNNAYKIRGLPVPPRPVPEPPIMLSCSNVMAIAWRGSVGAESYDVERAISPSGPWTTAGTSILENTDPYRPFSDTSIRVWGQSYYYRMKARNVAGVSAPSKVLGPVLAVEAIVDEMKDFSWMYAHTTNLACGKGDGSHFRGDQFTMSRTESTNASFVYRTTSAMNNFSVHAFFWPPEPVVDVTFSTSADGVSYAGFKPAISNFGGDWIEFEYTGVNLPSDTRYLKIGLMGTSSNYWNPQIGRLHIGCQRAPGPGGR